MTRLFFLFVMPAMLCCQKAARAQPELPPVFHLTERDGLGSRYASSLVEDKQRGYIWIGTRSGIWRYDGETLIKVYPQKSAGGPSADTYLAITLLLADSKGDVWFFDDTKCVKRVSHTNGTIDTFYVNANGRNDPIEFYNTFYTGGMHQDRKGRIWANTTSQGLVFFDAKKNNFVPAPISHTLDHAGNTGKIYEDAEGWFWFGNKLKPVRYNPETGEVWFDKNNPKKWPVFDLYSSTFFVDSKQRMWLAEFSNGYRYDLKTQKVERLSDLYQASGFVEDSLGYVWFGRYYNNFLTRYDPHTDTFERYYSNENDSYGLHIADWIASVQMDSRGVLWALDVRNINAFNPVARQPFQVFKAEADGGATPLPKGEVSDVFRAGDGRYYISYWMLDGGVVVLDSNFVLQEKWGWGHREKDFHQKAGWNAIEDNEGRIWTTQQNGSFSIYDAKSRRLSKMICPEFEGTSPYMAMKDRSGNLWWGLWRSKGITKWDCRAKKFTNYPLVPGDHGLVYNIIEGDSSIFWLATEKGIIKFDYRTGKSLHNFLPPSSDSTNRLREVVVGLVKTNDSTLVGGCTDGFFEFNLKTETYQLLQLNNGEKAPLCMSPMMLDSTGNIFYGYMGGIVRFHPATRRISIIPLTETIGFPFQPRFFPNPLPNRRLAFAANDRFVILDIAALENEVPVPVPKLTLFMVDGDTTALGRNLEKPIRLRHNENYFSLHFSSFAQPDQAIYYSYRLKGLQNEWSQPSPTPNARFTNVPPGEYTFELRAQLANGTPTEVSAFPFEILPPFWQTWWFRLLAVAAVAVLIRLIFRYRLRQQLEKEAIRLRIARDLHDEVGSTLTTISILSESVLRQMELDGEKARLSGIGDKARTAMSSMSDIVWSVNPQNDSMDKIVERMIRFATDTLEPLGISAVFDIEKEVYALQIPMEQRKDFYLFFKEATTNVAKHSGATRAVFSLKKTGRQLLFTIEDDGKGLPPQPQGSLGGNGLANMRARAEALGAQLDIKTEPNNGVLVSLRMPTA